MTSTNASATSDTKRAVRKRRRVRPDVEPRPPSVSAACGSGREALRPRVQAEEKAGRDGDREREQQDARVDAGLREPRDRRRGRDAASGPIAQDASSSPSVAADGRDAEALREELAHDPPAPGAQRGADRELLLPRRAACELEVRDVDAGDQEDERRRRRAASRAAGRTSSKSFSSSGRTVAVCAAVGSGYCTSSCRMMPASSVRASASVAARRRAARAPAPRCGSGGLSQDLVAAVEPDRAVEVDASWERSRSRAAARRRSCAGPRRGGASCRSRPRSAPKRVRQSSSLRTTAGAAPGRSSAATRSRPSGGRGAEQRKELRGDLADAEELAGSRPPETVISSAR